MDPMESVAQEERDHDEVVINDNVAFDSDISEVESSSDSSVSEGSHTTASNVLTQVFLSLPFFVETIHRITPRRTGMKRPKKLFHRGKAGMNAAGKVVRHAPPMRIKVRAVKMLQNGEDFENIRRTMWFMSRENFPNYFL